MPRVTEEPITKNSDSVVSETVTIHPAYAQIGASRVSGHAFLYDSDFYHQHYITITICGSELHRGLNRDWHFGRGDLIQVALSEAQWATFVSSPNQGSGVPCTLERFNGRMIPGLPEPKSRVDQFSNEVATKLKETLDSMEKALKELSAIGLSKAKHDKVAAAITTAYRELAHNMPFVANQFSEHMESSVEAAKQEIHGYMTNVIQRAGLAALAKDQLPLRIKVDDGKSLPEEDFA